MNKEERKMKFDENGQKRSLPQSSWADICPINRISFCNNLGKAPTTVIAFAGYATVKITVEET